MSNNFISSVLLLPTK